MGSMDKEGVQRLETVVVVCGRKSHLNQSACPEGGKEVSCLLGEGLCKVRRSAWTVYPLWLDDFMSGVPPWDGHTRACCGESGGGCGKPLEHVGHPGNVSCSLQESPSSLASLILLGLQF